MGDVFKKCKLCDKESNLRNSHIIPECLFEGVYDDKHRIITINNENYNQLEIIQQGYREYLLCQDCENKFSRWEKVLKEDLDKITQEQGETINLKDGGKISIIKTTNIRYDPFKKAILSILWRMSITTIKEFSGYQLGPYKIILKSLLNNNIYIEPKIFPITISKTYDLNLFLKGSIFLFNQRIIDENKITSWDFIIDGYQFCIYIVTEKHLKMQLKNNFRIPLNLNEKENIIIKFDINQFKNKQAVFKRLYDNDVRKFYDKIS